MEAWNRAAFLALNAPEHPAPGLVPAAMAIAQGAIFLVPLLLVILWLWGGREDRGGLPLAFVCAEVALGLNQVAALIWFHPRPFAVPIGRTLVEHVADSSFPSDHVTFLVAVGLGLLAWSHQRRAGLLTLALALPVAWARLFLGVHFPLDMMPRWIEPLHRRAFSIPIDRGWVRP